MNRSYQGLTQLTTGLGRTAIHQAFGWVKSFYGHVENLTGGVVVNKLGVRKTSEIIDIVSYALKKDVT